MTDATPTTADTGSKEGVRPWTAKEASAFPRHDFGTMERPRECDRCGYVEHDGSGIGWHPCSVTFVTPPSPIPAAEQSVEAIRAEIINTPETADFMAGVPIEAAHQRERWGSDHDAGKTPFDWFWLVGYLAQKAATSQVAGHLDKALHHTISTAAALANWHAAISGTDTAMRPGIEPPAALRTPDRDSLGGGR